MAMIDRFTEQAKDAIRMAADVARELEHSYVGTEHLLLGIARESRWDTVMWGLSIC